jgi:hypothetical protein
MLGFLLKASPLRALERGYSPECVEGGSLLKNSLYAHSDPGSGPKYTEFGTFWSFWSPIGSHFRLGADFFNSAPWPLPGHPEAMKMDPSP